jgi:hypothetical protein
LTPLDLHFDALLDVLLHGGRVATLAVVDDLGGEGGGVASLAELNLPHVARCPKLMDHRLRIDFAVREALHDQRALGQPRASDDEQERPATTAPRKRRTRAHDETRFAVTEVKELPRYSCS